MKNKINKYNEKKKLSFIELLEKTNFFLYGPSKGTIFFTPKSFYVWTKVQKFLDQRFNEINVKNVYFPSFIPVELFNKEKKHVEGFAPEFFYVYSKNNPTQQYVLRPTSEVIFAYYFQKTISSYKDLPLLLNQWVNVFRVEKNVNPFLRNCEFLWNEGHTLHITETDAILFCNKIFKIYRDFFINYAKINVFEGFKSEYEKFAGAKKTWTLETILKDGQFLQLATVHFLDNNFTKGFDIKYLNQNNQKKFPVQTSWGLSTRVIAGLILGHCDEHGIKLPKNFLEHNIIIIPIFFRENEEQKKQILNYCKVLLQKIKLTNKKVYLYQENIKNLSSLYQKLEINGMPLRLEIGRKEKDSDQVTYLLRNDLQKKTLLRKVFLQNFSDLLQQYDQNLFLQNKEDQVKKIVVINDFNEYQKYPKKYAFEVFFCNQQECEKEIKKKTQTVSRCLWETKKSSQCFHCQKNTNIKAYFGRSY